MLPPHWRVMKNVMVNAVNKTNPIGSRLKKRVHFVTVVDRLKPSGMQRQEIMMAEMAPIGKLV